MSYAIFSIEAGSQRTLDGLSRVVDGMLRSHGLRLSGFSWGQVADHVEYACKDEGIDTETVCECLYEAIRLRDCVFEAEFPVALYRNDIEWENDDRH
jgi:hypothetical protein